nr:MAG TPA: hypothetical protein [Caudoviricetes sp.]
MEIINIDEHFNLEQYCKQYVKEHDEWPTVYKVQSHSPLFKTAKNFGVFTEYEEAKRTFEINRFVDDSLEEETIELIECSGPRLCFEVAKRKALIGCKIMLAIKPEYVEKIFDGLKRYEYRRRIPNHPVSQIVIYETAPVSKIVGEVDVDEMLGTAPHVLYDMTKKWAGISEEGYNDYFKGSNVAYAYSINYPTIFSRPVSIKEYGLRGAPQSYVYLEEFQ